MPQQGADMRAEAMRDEAPDNRMRPAAAEDAARLDKNRKLTAYRLLPKGPKLVPAWVNRPWMDATADRWAYRCLPLNVANEAGWMVLNPRDVEVTWNGSAPQHALRVKFLDGRPATSDVLSMFGYGIVTWRIPYLFRTPPGFNLLVRGPANLFKEAASPLEGLVESDWVVTSFTMSWKITIPFWKVRFQKDEPIGMLVPQRRHDLEALEPEIRNIESNPELEKSFTNWSASRQAFMQKNRGRPAGSSGRPWQKHYVWGVGPSGEQAPEHQVKIELRPFEEREPPLQPGDATTPQRGVPLALLGGGSPAPRSPVDRFKRWLRFMLGSLQRWSY